MNPPTFDDTLPAGPFQMTSYERDLRYQRYVDAQQITIIELLHEILAVLRDMEKR